MVAGMAACYVCGSWWFSIYAGVSMTAAAMACVLPWLIPDGIKLALAYTMAKRIGRNITL